jgi:hypothetical protein
VNPSLELVMLCCVLPSRLSWLMNHEDEINQLPSAQNPPPPFHLFFFFFFL